MSWITWRTSLFSDEILSHLLIDWIEDGVLPREEKVIELLNGERGLWCIVSGGFIQKSTDEINAAIFAIVEIVVLEEKNARKDDKPVISHLELLEKPSEVGERHILSIVWERTEELIEDLRRKRCFKESSVWETENSKELTGEL